MVWSHCPSTSVCSLGCFGPSATMTTNSSHVKCGFQPSSFSPEFSDDEPDGIKIAIPAVHTFSVDDEGERNPLPLCLTLRFNALYLERFEFVFEALKVVVVDDEHAKTLTGGVWRHRHYIPNEPTEIPPEELAKRIATEYSTVDLLEFFDLPHRNATYKVYALLEEHKSNVVTVKMKAR